MNKTIIYNNGNIKLEHLTRIQFRSKLNNQVLTGKVVGQEATNFIVRISTSFSAKVNTCDILQVAVPCGDEEYFISLKEYRKQYKTKLTAPESSSIVNAINSSIKNTETDTTISQELKDEIISNLTNILHKYIALEPQILQLETI